MTYNFQGNNKIDYIVYTPRLDGNINGNFGNIEVWYKTTPNGTPIKAKDADLGYSGSPSRIELTTPLVNVRAVIIKVLNGGNNFAALRGNGILHEEHRRRQYIQRYIRQPLHRTETRRNPGKDRYHLHAFL